MTSWVEISEQRLLQNYRVIAETAGTAVLAVVKANAYGHGVERCARILAQGGAKWLGVTGVEEGMAVRRALSAAGIAIESQPRVLVMSGIAQEDADAVVAEELTPVIWSVEQVRWLRAAASGSGSTVQIHVEVDSGMTRQGVRPGPELRAVAKAIQEAKELRLDGLMTHIASAEVAGSRHSIVQRQMFEAALVDTTSQEYLLPPWVHIGNTSGVDLAEADEDFLDWVRRMGGNMAAPMVRTGLGLYGYSLPLETTEQSQPAASRLGERLQPVMTWKAKVIGLENIPAGARVGYNGTYVTRRPMRLALVAAGYADGLRRELSSTNEREGGWVMLRGQRAPIVGRVSMNLTSVDVSGIDEVKLGDEAVLLGDGITAEDHARIAGTISYEILCGVRGTERG